MVWTRRSAGDNRSKGDMVGETWGGGTVGVDLVLALSIKSIQYTKAERIEVLCKITTMMSHPNLLQLLQAGTHKSVLHLLDLLMA